YDGTQAVAVDESNKLIGAANPVVAGRVMVVYLTGIGPVSPALAAGVAAPGDALRRASLPFSATLSGQPAEVAFLGLTPGFVGLAQANITVPPETPAGPQPLVLTVGGAESNRVTVQVVQP
ncbi:MAG: hypothetical protein JNN08_12865, partial [Bryobacterales bacterium]|nr:hypothetical protein [Bryobacterales bacterium]